MTRFSKVELAAMEKAGSAADISRRIESYGAAVDRMSSRLEQLEREFPDHWVALHEDEIVATKVSLDELIRLCEERGLVRGSLVIRYLGPDKPVRILCSR